MPGFFFFEKDRTYVLACLPASIQPRTGLKVCQKYSKVTKTLRLQIGADSWREAAEAALVRLDAADAAEGAETAEVLTEAKSEELVDGTGTSKLHHRK